MIDIWSLFGLVVSQSDARFICGYKHIKVQFKGLFYKQNQNLTLRFKQRIIASVTHALVVSSRTT